MARSKKDKNRLIDEYAYHGRKVRLIEPAKEGEPHRLQIDDQEVEYVQTEEGVYSHAMMYAVFSTPYALAEALIRDWGTARVDLTKVEHTDHHDHSDHDNHSDHDDH